MPLVRLACTWAAVLALAGTAAACASPPPKDVVVHVTSVRARVVVDGKDAPVPYLSDVAGDAKVRFECAADAPWSKVRPLLVRLASTPVKALELVSTPLEGKESSVETGIAAGPSDAAPGTTVLVDVRSQDEIFIGPRQTDMLGIAAEGSRFSGSSGLRFLVHAADTARVADVVDAVVSLRQSGPVVLTPAAPPAREEAR